MIPAWLRRVIPSLTDDERTSDARALLRSCPPVRVVIDPGLRQGQWYIVRGFQTAQERAIHAAACAADRPEWAPTQLLERPEGRDPT